jgi:hypothetical protein
MAHFDMVSEDPFPMDGTTNFVGLVVRGSPLAWKRADVLATRVTTVILRLVLRCRAGSGLVKSGKITNPPDLDNLVKHPSHVGVRHFVDNYAQVMCFNKVKKLHCDSCGGRGHVVVVIEIDD